MYKIMIIEDNAKIRSELGEFLSKNGYEAVSYTHLHTFSMLILRIIDEPTPKPHTAKMCIRDRLYCQTVKKFLPQNNAIQTADSSAFFRFHNR